MAHLDLIWGQQKRTVALLSECGHGGCVVECRTVSRGEQGSDPPAAVSKLGQFRSPHFACFLKRLLVGSTWCLHQGN